MLRDNFALPEARLDEVKDPASKVRGCSSVLLLTGEAAEDDEVIAAFDSAGEFDLAFTGALRERFETDVRFPPSSTTFQST